jgi:PAS domain S-box-containing protein
MSGTPDAFAAFDSGLSRTVPMDNQAIAVTRALAGDPSGAEDILVAPPPLIELLPLGIYACDAVGHVRWFNRRAAELWGRSPVIGSDADRFCGSHKLYGLDGKLIRRDETPMAQALRTGEAVDGAESAVERPDGSRFIAMVHINPLKDSVGNIIGAINCFHDITAIRSEDRRLRESERQFRELLDSLPAAIYTTDAAGRITYYNEAAVALAGRRPAIGTDEWCVTWRLYMPDGTPLPHDQCPMAVVLKEDRPVRGVEAVAERPDGTRVPFLPYPTPLHDAFGNVVGAVNMLVDISHRKDAETQQRILFSEVNHRTKNNIQMLHALLNAAQRETASAEVRAAFGDAIRRIGAMAAAQTVLYQANNAGCYRAGDFLAAVCAAARQALGGKGVTIRCDAAEGELSNDTATPLALIVNELVTNAVKHGINGRGEGEGEGAVTVSLLREAAGQFALRVEDEGPGFELPKTRRRSSGLGLVMGLVNQIGGTFAVERAPGARCTVRFPVASAC